jgi:hypothetical protein
MRYALAAATLATLWGSALTAQQAVARASTREPDTIVVVTVPLKHLTSNEAIALLSPYVGVGTPGNGVFSVPTAHAVTIRSYGPSIARMRAVLAEYDRAPMSVTLTFQLIAADDTPSREQGLAGLDSVLRGVLKFSGYHLLGTAIGTASEGAGITQTLTSEPEPMKLEAIVREIRTDLNEPAVRLDVTLTRENATAVWSGNASRIGHEVLLESVVTVPAGQTIVLGTAAGRGTAKALILTVKPQLTVVKSK